MTTDLTQEKDYELAFLAVNQEGSQNLDALLKQYKAEALFKSPLKEWRLAYPVKKYNLAYFGFVNFRLDSTLTDKLSQSLKLQPDILRFLIITPPIIKEAKTAVRRFSKLESVKRPKAEIAEAEAVPSMGGTLSNEALEQKLEEILK